jgi:phenylacetate-CoA ligase
MIAENQIDSLALDKIDPVEFWRVLGKFNPTRLTAFPSALAAMIQRDKLAAQKTRITALKAVFLTGEVTFPWQRHLIEKVLQVPCFESYGVQEAGAIAYECTRRTWHTCAESVIVEYICDGRPARTGELAEIVVTGLKSHAMPLIRYRTGDWVRVRDESCGCGLSLPVIPRLLGRSSDFLINDEGSPIEPALAIEALSPILGQGAFQIQQSPIGALEISILDNGCNREDQTAKLAMALQYLFGHRVAYTIRRVERLTRTEFGKCLYIHSSTVPRPIS